MDNKEPELAPVEREDGETARTLAELVIEAVEVCLKDGTWDPETGIVGKEDTLQETWINASKKHEMETRFESPGVSGD